MARVYLLPLVYYMYNSYKHEMQRIGLRYRNLS